jgi:PLP dependent protein
MDTDQIRARIHEVQGAILRAADRAGSDAAAVRLVVVTKTHPIETVLKTLAAGATDIGENRVQEAVPKLEAVRAAGVAGCRFHLIGHLQSNKAKAAVRYFDLIHSLDSVDLALALDRHALAAGTVRECLLQVNVSGEETKSGLDPETAGPALAGILRECSSLRIAGLMTMAPLVEDPETTRPVFRALRALSERLRDETGGELGPELSMGMTNDFEVAVEEGATLVRIGSAILGAR